MHGLVIQLLLVLMFTAGCQAVGERPGDTPFVYHDKPFVYHDNDSGLTYYYKVSLGHEFPGPVCKPIQTNPHYLWVLVRLWSGSDNVVTRHEYLVSRPLNEGKKLVAKIVSGSDFRSLRTASADDVGYVNWITIEVPGWGLNCA